MNEWTLFLKKLINVKFWGNDLKKKIEIHRRGGPRRPEFINTETSKWQNFKKY